MVSNSLTGAQITQLCLVNIYKQWKYYEHWVVGWGVGRGLNVIMAREQEIEAASNASH